MLARSGDATDLRPGSDEILATDLPAAYGPLHRTLDGLDCSNDPLTPIELTFRTVQSAISWDLLNRDLQSPNSFSPDASSGPGTGRRSDHVVDRVRFISLRKEDVFRHLLEPICLAFRVSARSTVSAPGLIALSDCLRPIPPPVRGVPWHVARMMLGATTSAFSPCPKTLTGSVSRRRKRMAFCAWCCRRQLRPKRARSSSSCRNEC
jgi:hypothetical protein